MPVMCTLNVASLHVADVVMIGGDGGVGNYTVEGCVFLENEAPEHGSAVAMVPLWTYFNYGRLGIIVIRNK